jgi:hypothetical protein
MDASRKKSRGEKMIVSFDLDDTLFVDPEKVEIEKPIKFPFSLIYKDKMRKGTIELFDQIKKMNHTIIIYTSSYRSIDYIKGYFKKYKIAIKSEDIINGKRHADEVQRDHKQILPSKIPSRYGSDLHIDDDISVEQNGQVYGFDVYLINPQDKEWVSKILKEIKRIEKRMHAMTGPS